MTGFTGPEYEIFASELAAYGYPVILAWLRRGVIFKYCTDRGRPVGPADVDRETLAGSFEERLELALETAAAALTFFRTHVLVGKRWSYNGGATLTTYFVGACLFAFPNVFRKWQGEQRRWRGGVTIEMLNCPDGRPAADQPGSDPADIVASRAVVRDELNAMPADTRPAAALVPGSEPLGEQSQDYRQICGPGADHGNEDDLSASVPDSPEPPPDVEGLGLQPDPLTATTPAELIGMLRLYRKWAGQPSFRKMAAASGQKVSASSLCTALGRDEMPRLDVITTVIAGCGGDEERQRRWASAWRRLELGSLEWWLDLGSTWVPW